MKIAADSCGLLASRMTSRRELAYEYRTERRVAVTCQSRGTYREKTDLRDSDLLRVA